MAANIAKVNRFAELRAEGRSFSEISKEINISKPTLIKWSREYREKVERFTKLNEEQFLAEEKLKRTIRARRLSGELDKAYDALEKTEYKDLSKRELMGVIERLEKKLQEYTKPDYIVEPEKFNIVISRKLIKGETKEATLVEED